MFSSRRKEAGPWPVRVPRKMCVLHCTSQRFRWLGILKHYYLITGLVGGKVCVKCLLNIRVDALATFLVRPFERIEGRIDHDDAGMRQTLLAAVTHKCDRKCCVRDRSVALNFTDAVRRTGSDVIIEFGSSRIRIKDENVRNVIDKFEFYDRETPASLNDLPTNLSTTQLVPSLPSSAISTFLCGHESGVLAAALMAAKCIG